MEVNYCLKISLPGKDNPSGKSNKRYNGRIWRIQWWFKPRNREEPGRRWVRKEGLKKVRGS